MPDEPTRQNGADGNSKFKAVLLATVEIGLLGTCVYFTNKLTNIDNCVDGNGYFAILTIIAMCMAGFVFGFLESAADVSGKYIGVNYKLTGAAGFAFLIIIVGITTENKCGDFNLLVQLQGPGKAFLAGELGAAKISVRTESGGEYEGEFTPRGKAVVQGIPFRQRSKDLHLTLDSDKFELKDGYTTISNHKWGNDLDTLILPVVRVPVVVASGETSAASSVSSPSAHLTEPAKQAPLNGPVEWGERVALVDAFASYNESAYNLARRKVVPWGDLGGDLGASTAGPGNVMLFMPFDAQPYADGSGSAAGIALAPDQSLSVTKDCRTKLPYAHHFFKVDAGKSYCIKLRRADQFAKILVTSVDPRAVTFDWVIEQ